VVEDVYTFIADMREEVPEERLPAHLAAWTLSGIQLRKRKGKLLPTFVTARMREEALNWEARQLPPEGERSPNQQVVADAVDVIRSHREIEMQNLERRRRLMGTGLSLTAEAGTGGLGKAFVSLVGAADWRLIKPGELRNPGARYEVNTNIERGDDVYASHRDDDRVNMPYHMWTEMCWRAQERLKKRAGPRGDEIKLVETLTPTLSGSLNDEGHLKHQVAMRRAIQTRRVDDIKAFEREWNAYLANNPSVEENAVVEAVANWHGLWSPAAQARIHRQREAIQQPARERRKMQGEDAEKKTGTRSKSGKRNEAGMQIRRETLKPQGEIKGSEYDGAVNLWKEGQRSLELNPEWARECFQELAQLLEEERKTR